MTPRDNCDRAIHPGAPLAGNCPHCVRAHAIQRAEDRLIAGRAVTASRREAGRVTGQAHGVAFGPLPRNRNVRAPVGSGYCKRGHAFTADNTRYGVRNSRTCKTCQRMLAVSA